jgi:pyruvate dehydrogenase (quinone)
MNGKRRLIGSLWHGSMANAMSQAIGGQAQKSSGFLDFGTKFKNPNFAAMAEAVGVRGIRLEDPGDVERGIAEALAHDGPALVDAVVSRMVLPIPPSITVEMAKGFTLYMLKAVMGGRGDDLIDLAKANLWE